MSLNRFGVLVASAVLVFTAFPSQVVFAASPADGGSDRGPRRSACPHR